MKAIAHGPHLCVSLAFFMVRFGVVLPSFGVLPRLGSRFGKNDEGTPPIRFVWGCRLGGRLGGRFGKNDEGTPPIRFVWGCRLGGRLGAISKLNYMVLGHYLGHPPTVTKTPDFVFGKIDERIRIK